MPINIAVRVVLLAIIILLSTGPDMTQAQTWTWRYPLAGARTSNIAVGRDNVAYVGANDGTGRSLYAIDSTGALLWSTSVPGIHGVSVTPDNVILCSKDKSVAALDSNGATLWESNQIPLSLSTPPAVAPDGTIVVGITYSSGVANYGKIHAYRPPQTGPVWTYPATDYLGAPVSHLAIGNDGAVHAALGGGELLEIDQDGNLLHSVDTDPVTGSDREVSAIALSSQGNAYFGNAEGRLYAISSSFDIAWSSPAAGHRPYQQASSLSTGDTLVMIDNAPVLQQLDVTDGDDLYWLGVSGWYLKGAPALGDDDKFYWAAEAGGSTSDAVHCASDPSGVQWSLVIGDSDGAHLSELVMAPDGALYVSDQDSGSPYLYRIPTTADAPLDSDWPMLRNNPGQTACAASGAYDPEDPDYLLAEGRDELLSGRVDGITAGRDLLAEARANAPDPYAELDQLRLLQSLADLGACLLAREDDGETSLAEVLDQYGIVIEGASLDALSVTPDGPVPQAAPAQDALRSYLDTRLQPQLAATVTLLNELVQADFVTQIPAGSGLFGDDVEIDNGDLLILQAALRGAQSACALLLALDVDLDRDDVLDLLDADGPTGLATTLEILLDGQSGLLRFDAAAQKTAARGFLLDAIATYLDASEHLRLHDDDAIPGAAELITIAAEQDADEQAFRTTITDLRDSLTANTAWVMQDGTRLDLNPLFATTGPDLRDMRPAIDAQGYPLMGTMADALGRDQSLGGVLPEVDSLQWNQQLCRFFDGASGLHSTGEDAPLPDYLSGAAVGPDKLFLSSWGRVRAYGAAASLSPVPLLYTLPTDDTYISAVVEDHSTLYVAHDGVIESYEIGADGFLAPLGTAANRPGGWINAMAARDGLLAYSYTAYGASQEELHVLDMRNPDAVRSMLGVTVAVNPYGWGEILALGEGRLYHHPPTEGGGSTSQVNVYSLPTTGTGALLGDFSAPLDLSALLEYRDTLYLCGGEGDLLSAEIANPAAPVFHAPAMEPVANTFESMQAFGDTLLLTGQPAITSYDISTPSAPRFIAAADSSQYTRHAAILTHAGKAMMPFDNSLRLYELTLLDSDGDDLDDAWELASFGNLAQAGDDDADADGLTNRMEMLLGADPELADTDGDGLPDGWEYDHMLLPRQQDATLDADGDGHDNLAEFRGGSDPWASGSQPQSATIPQGALFLLLGS